MNHPKYRADIDGLRAIAVGAVVLFHAMPQLAPGGFVGVDIFFVISGFLISTNLFQNLDAGTFSLLEFYIRRALRILPALLLLLTASFALGYFFLLADEMDSLGRMLIAGSAFTANIEVWRGANDIGHLTILQPLLHLWSLSVEEQFYIACPLMFAAAWRLRISPLVPSVAIALASFVWSLHQTDVAPFAAFYSMQTRAWELMAGAILAFLTYKQASPREASAVLDALSVFAILLMGYGATAAHTDSFPGLGAVPPVFGAAVIIFCGPNALANRLLLARAPMIALGLISYPLYLWHWTLLSFARILEAGPLSARERWLCVIVAVALSWATYRLVEKPIRYGARAPWKWRALFAGLLVMVALGFAATRGAFDGAGPRSPDRAAFARAFANAYPDWGYATREKLDEKFRAECDFYDLAYRLGDATRAPRATIDASCYTRDPAKPKAVFIWGDESARTLAWGLKQTLPADWQILVVASSACPPDAGPREDSATRYCPRSNVFALKAMAAAKPDVVLIAGFADLRYESLKALGDSATAAGAKAVLFAGPAPTWLAPLPALIERRMWDATPERTTVGLDGYTLAANARVGQDFAKAGDARFVDVAGMFCDERGCLTRVGPDRGRDIVSYDHEHLTPEAAEFVARGGLAKRVEGAGGG